MRDTKLITMLVKKAYPFLKFRSIVQILRTATLLANREPMAIHRTMKLISRHLFVQRCTQSINTDLHASIKASIGDAAAREVVRVAGVSVAAHADRLRRRGGRPLVVLVHGPHLVAALCIRTALEGKNRI